MSRSVLLLVAIALGACAVAWRVAGSDEDERAVGPVSAEREASAPPAASRPAPLAGTSDALAPVGDEGSADERVPLGPSKTRLVARIVDAEGVAIPALTFEIGFDPAGESAVDQEASESEKSMRKGDVASIELEARIDEWLKKAERDRQATEATARPGGRIEIDVPEALIGVTGRVLHLREVSDVYGNRSDLDVPLPDALTRGKHDLGKLRLPAAPLLVGGFVVDGRGEAVFGADVDVVIRRRAPFVREHRFVRTLANGGFRVTGDTDGVLGTELGAQFKSAGSGAPIAFAVGASDAVLTLRRAGSLRGRILQPATGVPANLRVVATPVDPPGEPVEIAPSRGGELLAHDLAPGNYTVRVTLGAEDAPVFALERVLVREGETTRPAALDPLDLRGLVREVRVRLTAPDRRAPAATVSYRASGDAETAWSAVEILAYCSLLTTAPALDLRVEGFGYRSVELFDVAVRADVALEPAFRAAFVLDRAAEEERVYGIEVLDPASGAELARAELKAEQRSQPPRANVTLCRTGSVLVRLTVRRSGGNAWGDLAREVARLADVGDVPVRASVSEPQGAVLSVVERNFDVLDAPDVQTFVLRM
jgi:hypothetical protein